MEELGLSMEDVRCWFKEERNSPYILVRVPSEHAERWVRDLACAIRRCYISDDDLLRRAEALQAELGGTLASRQAQIIGAKLPDPGSTMSGDFGEIITYLYQAARADPLLAFGPKKWKLKQDRTKPAPFSDVVHFILPTWPKPSGQDQLLCAEVKTKATAGQSTPISAAIAESAKDRTSRLSKTLVWLRERGIEGAPLGAITIRQLDRFINATDNPPARRTFSAVAIIHADYVVGELDDAPGCKSDSYTLVVVSIPNLKNIYEASFESAMISTAP